MTSLNDLQEKVISWEVDNCLSMVSAPATDCGQSQVGKGIPQEISYDRNEH